MAMHEPREPLRNGGQLLSCSSLKSYVFLLPRPSTPTRSTSLRGSLWRQKARRDLNTPYLQDWKQTQAQRNRRQLRGVAEAKTRMKSKQRRRDEGATEPQEGRGRKPEAETWRPAGQGA